jgi:hypothetical protein
MYVLVACAQCKEILILIFGELLFGNGGGAVLAAFLLVKIKFLH